MTRVAHYLWSILSPTDEAVSGLHLPSSKTPSLVCQRSLNGVCRRRLQECNLNLYKPPLSVMPSIGTKQSGQVVSSRFGKKTDCEGGVYDNKRRSRLVPLFSNVESQGRNVKVGYSKGEFTRKYCPSIIELSSSFISNVRPSGAAAAAARFLSSQGRQRQRVQTAAAARDHRGLRRRLNMFAE